jgi:4-hydroxybenzoate polyprenyltransferase
VGVSAHIANALPDLAMDSEAGVTGFVVSLGRSRATRLCWILLTLGSVILAVESFSSSAWLPVVLAVALAGAGLFARLSHSRSAMFNAILALVVVQVVVLVTAVALSETLLVGESVPGS